MSAGKVKTVIIIMLLAANLFFVFNIIKLNNEKMKISSKMIEDADIILKKRSVYLNKNVIDRSKSYYSVYEGRFGRESFADIIKNIAGTEETDEGMGLPDKGFMFSGGDYNFSFFGYSDISINDNAFLLSIEKKDSESGRSIISKEQLYEKIKIEENDNFSSRKKKEAETALNKFFKNYRYTNKNYRILSLEKDKSSGKTTLLLNQAQNGLDIYSNKAYVEIENGEVVYFGGKWYFGEFYAEYSLELLDSVNVILSATANKENIFQKNELTKMKMYYVTVEQKSAEFYIIPMWEFIFKSGESYFFNALNSEEYTKTTEENKLIYD